VQGAPDGCVSALQTNNGNREHVVCEKSGVRIQNGQSGNIDFAAHSILDSEFWILGLRASPALESCEGVHFLLTGQKPSVIYLTEDILNKGV